MANVQAFGAVNNGTVNIDVSGSTQRVSLGVSGRGVSQVEVFNDGTATAWIAFGDVTVTTAVTTGRPIAAGGCVCASIKPGETYATAIAASTTGKIYFTPGSGL